MWVQRRQGQVYVLKDLRDDNNKDTLGLDRMRVEMEEIVTAEANNRIIKIYRRKAQKA